MFSIPVRIGAPAAVCLLAAGCGGPTSAPPAPPPTTTIPTTIPTTGGGPSTTTDTTSPGGQALGKYSVRIVISGEMHCAQDIPDGENWGCYYGGPEGVRGNLLAQGWIENGDVFYNDTHPCTGSDKWPTGGSNCTAS